MVVIALCYRWCRPSLRRSCRRQMAHWCREIPEREPSPRSLPVSINPVGAAGRKYGFDVAGTVKEWQDKIARPLEGCSNVALAAGMAFAAPVFFFAGEQSGGFHIWCDSTFGKSAAGAVGESIYGRPSTTRGNVECVRRKVGQRIRCRDRRIGAETHGCWALPR